uniref:Cytochrome P450 n=1 Tax=Meloidogyne hapla TaxID=6305 RepID=A0A1I8BAA3_MELHA
MLFLFSSFFPSLLLIILPFFIWRFITRLSNNKMPPGPFHFPLIGNFAQLDLCYPHRSFVYWKQKFGPIYTVWLPTPYLVIAGHKQMQELLVNSNYADIFADRPTFSYSYGVFNNFQPDGDGIVLARQQVWKKNRSFAMSALKNLGMGRSEMENRINVHKNALILRLTEIANNKNGIVVDIDKQFDFCAGNVIHDLIFGRHYIEYNHPEFVHLKQLIDNAIKEVASVQMLIVNCWPWARALFPAYWRYVRQGFALQRFFLKEVDIHIAKIKESKKLNGNEMDEPECFIEAYLKAAIAEGQSINDPALRLTIAICSGDLWAAGIETAAATMTWAIVYLLNYPDIQLKLQAELDSHLGDQPFHFADLNNMPYLRAFVDELQRVINLLPWNVPHSVSKEVQLGEWIIPKDTIVMVQLGAVHLDPSLFPQPEVFRPERFLDPEGNYKGSELLKPFGIGKNGVLPSLNRNIGTVTHADPFTFKLSLRKKKVIQ